MAPDLTLDTRALSGFLQDRSEGWTATVTLDNREAQATFIVERV